MKKLSILLVLAIILAGGAVCAVPHAANAQYYPPPQPAAVPWVGPNTPWVYYNGDWFLNGVLQYFFGPRYGWAPYYAYPSTYIVRPHEWYAPRWRAWYQAHPGHWEDFHRRYPYWRDHRTGRHYGEDFYERHHHGEGGGWHHGWHGDR